MKDTYQIGDRLMFRISRKFSDTFWEIFVLGGWPSIFVLMFVFISLGVWIGFTSGVFSTTTVSPSRMGSPVVPIPDSTDGFTIPAFKKKYWLFDEFVPTTSGEKKIVSFVRRFYETCQTEEELYGQPASVKLAQAILESKIGESKLTVKANNYFGMKCHSKTCKKGHCLNFSDDSHKDFFLVFPSAWASFRAHSHKVEKGSRYDGCHGQDWRGWCKCLKSKGYATSKTYSEKLIGLIEKYHLNEFDK